MLNYKPIEYFRLVIYLIDKPAERLVYRDVIYFEWRDQCFFFRTVSDYKKINVANIKFLSILPISPRT